MDETGFDASTHRPFAWARPGQRVLEYIHGNTRHRTSLIGGYLQRQLIAPMLYEGTCNTWLEQQLLPILPPGSVLVLDNAAFHNAVSIQTLVTHAGHRLLFLSPYSPHLIPIEKGWANLKRQWQYHPHRTLDQLIASSHYWGD